MKKLTIIFFVVVIAAVFFYLFFTKNIFNTRQKSINDSDEISETLPATPTVPKMSQAGGSGI